MLDKTKQRPHRSHYMTDVILLLDMSGSMDVRRDETIREVNRYLDKLREDGNRYRIQVKVFNEEVQTLVHSKDIKDVGELEHSEYKPKGWTRLLDAVGDTLSGVYWRRSYQPPRTLFVVITDGAENDSRNYGLSEVRSMIDRYRSDDFQFVFLGDGPGAWRTGNRLGFNISVSTDWQNPENSRNIYKSLYTASNTMSTGGIISPRSFNTGSTQATWTVDPTKQGDTTGGSQQ